MQMSITGLVVFIIILVLAIYDLGCVVFRGTGSSVSNFLIKAGVKAPMVTLGFGATIGHLFAVMYPDHCPPPSANILAPNFWMGFSLLLIGLIVAREIALRRNDAL